MTLLPITRTLQMGIASGAVAPPRGASSARTGWRWHPGVSPCARSAAEQGDEAGKAKHIGALQIILGVRLLR